MKMKALYVNHNDETFAELTHGQALDVIFNADNAEMYGDHVNQIVDLGNEVKLELYRNNEFVPFAGYYERVKTLSELFKTSEENIDKLIRKGLNSKSWIFHPEQFTEFSGICSEDLIIMSIRVLSSLSERLGLSDKFITDFIYPISQYKGEDMTANRLKFIVFTILSLDK